MNFQFLEKKPYQNSSNFKFLNKFQSVFKKWQTVKKEFSSRIELLKFWFKYSVFFNKNFNQKHLALDNFSASTKKPHFFLLRTWKRNFQTDYLIEMSQITVDRIKQIYIATLVFLFLSKCTEVSFAQVFNQFVEIKIRQFVLSIKAKIFQKCRTCEINCYKPST